jgi:hypothetical protein
VDAGVLASGVRILEITHGSIYLSQNPPRRDVAFGGRYESLLASYGVPDRRASPRGSASFGRHSAPTSS